MSLCSKSPPKPLIVHIITTLNTGGAEKSLVKLLLSIDRGRFDSAVIVLQGGPLSELIRAVDIPVHEFGIRPNATAALKLPALIRLIRKLNPDILHGWMPHGNLIAQCMAPFSRNRTPVVWSVRHSMASLPTENAATAALIRLSACISSRPFCVLYNSQLSAKEHSHWGYRPQRTRVIPNGFDCEMFHPDSDARKSVRKELSLPDNAILIGLIARYHEVKDHVSFMRAAATTAQLFPNVYFVLAGTGVDSEQPELIAQIRHLGLQGRVHLLGERSDTPRLTAALDIGTLSSLAEAFPNSLAEAMACGVPCVSTAVGDCEWIIGDTGRIVPIRDPVAISSAWQELLNMHLDQRRKMGESARERILASFSLDKVVHQYESLYREALPSKRRDLRINASAASGRSGDMGSTRNTLSRETE